ncbi:proline dehydrogenase family protein [Halomontanus rarus]|uniref:proline dehydrogenase family protein n=1 Tax=Halomontanus rarus TaxID=3034020 RepID=UPI001A9A205A
MIPPIANRFVSGETEAEALDHARKVNGSGIDAMVNRLGSHYRNRSRVDADLTTYRLLVDDIANAKLNATVSVKPTQLGLYLGEDVFRESIGDLVARARERDVFVWLDMEEYTTVDATLDAYRDLATEYNGGIGVCVQASLKRTPDDLLYLADVPGSVRLAKGGAYNEPPAVAYQEKSRVNQAYQNLLEYAFEEFDDGIAVASHDPEMIDHAVSLHEEHGTEFELQMLMGVRPHAQIELAESYDVCQYVPFGTRWKRWFYNRVRNNVRIATRAAFNSVGLNRIRDHGPI